MSDYFSRIFLGLLTLMLVGVGCAANVDSDQVDVKEHISTNEMGDSEEVEDPMKQRAIHSPLEIGELSFKGFGEWISDRFLGYHVGIDIEAPADTLVYAVADGEVVYADWVSGYGGVMLVQHVGIRDEEIVTAIYGHVDPSSMETVGEEVVAGQQIAVLGEESAEETDTRREHLHFALYLGEEIKLQGYELEEEAVGAWMNPVDVIGKTYTSENRQASDLQFAEGEALFGGIDFFIPDAWDIEYIPQIESLNLYALEGEGTARGRSQVLIRYFDASDFLTLSSVDILSTQDLTVGQGDFIARRYEIEKKDGVVNFTLQPSWRNERHVVTDFRTDDGYTRYYVVAKNPDLDMDVYEEILASVVRQ